MRVNGPDSDTGAAAISTGVASAGAGVVEDSATARATVGVAPLPRDERAAPVDPCAAAAGDWTELAITVRVGSVGLQGSKAGSASGSGPGATTSGVAGRPRSAVNRSRPSGAAATCPGPAAQGRPERRVGIALAPALHGGIAGSGAFLVGARGLARDEILGGRDEPDVEPRPGRDQRPVHAAERGDADAPAGIVAGGGSEGHEKAGRHRPGRRRRADPSQSRPAILHRAPIRLVPEPKRVFGRRPGYPATRLRER